MKIDLHVHSSERSACGKASEAEQIRAAIAAGLDAIAFTDHHQLVPTAHLARLNQDWAPFRIFGGIEITASGEDFLVFGLSDPALESSDWQYPDLHTFVRSQGGMIALAHPFRYHPVDYLPLDQFPPDAIEAFSVNTPVSAEKEICQAAARLGIPVVSNSDAHRTEALGLYYNLLDEPVQSEAQLLARLRAGKFRCVASNGKG